MEQAAREDAELGTTTVEISGSSPLSVSTQLNLSAEEVGDMEKRAYKVSVVRESVLTRDFLESGNSKVPDVISFTLASHPTLV